MGGTQYHNQTFNAQTNKAMCSLLVLASIAIAMCAHVCETPVQLLFMTAQAQPAQRSALAV